MSDIYNYRDAGENLAISGQPTEDQLRDLAAQGFEAVINLALHNDPKYSLPDEAGLVRELGLAYTHIPVQFAEPTEQNLLDFFAAMDHTAARRTLVHCAANYRVTAFLGLYRAIRLNQSPDEAFALMRETWTPNPTWSAFIESMLAKHPSR
ncbi:MAG TPA: protein tyrosine phosphatase family protein [Bryobacteraceae bacterium]|nr:protein tyrosine phosphatase family protein [Bryobacteraceae bacterium]